MIFKKNYDIIIYIYLWKHLYYMDGEEKNNNFEDLNIFNEITQNSEVKKDTNKIKEEKNIYDYMSFYTNIFKIINYLLFVIVLVFSSYVYVQQSKPFYEQTYLNLFCPILLWKDVSDFISWQNCSSIVSYNEKITKDVNTLKQEQFNKIIIQIPKVYELTSSKTKEKEFLLSKSTWRLKVLNIIEEFENLKNEYSYVDKDRIVCNNISIDSNNIFKANCEAYSSYWDEDIVWYDWVTKVNWTSITVAMSFLNYIQAKSNKFTLVNKQKSFSQESTNVGFYTYKTGFSLEMKYNWSNLSF